MKEEIPYYETEIYKEACKEVDYSDGYDDLIKKIIWYKQRIIELEEQIKLLKKE